jgi:hypothetical protein
VNLGGGSAGKGLVQAVVTGEYEVLRQEKEMVVFGQPSCFPRAFSDLQDWPNRGGITESTSQEIVHDATQMFVERNGERLPISN